MADFASMVAAARTVVVRALGVSCRYTPRDASSVEVTALFDQSPEAQQRQSGAYELTLSVSAIGQNPAKGDQVTIADATYVVGDVTAVCYDGLGGVTVPIRRIRE